MLERRRESLVGGVVSIGWVVRGGRGEKGKRVSKVWICEKVRRTNVVILQLACTGTVLRR